MLYQIEERVRTKKVMVEERIDGSLRIVSKGAPVRFHQICALACTDKDRPFLPKGKGHRPPIDHAWRPPWFRKSIKEEDRATEVS